MGRNFRLRVLLVFVDDENNQTTLQELNKIAFACDFTLILAWSNAECARYIETFKAYEGKSAVSIQEKVETEFLPKLTSVLTNNIRSVNKTDVVTLLSMFGSFSGICQASEEELVQCPGIGDKKVKRLFRTLHEPFLPQQQPVKATAALAIGETSGKSSSTVSSRKVTGEGLLDDGEEEDFAKS